MKHFGVASCGRPQSISARAAAYIAISDPEIANPALLRTARLVAEIWRTTRVPQSAQMRIGWFAVSETVPSPLASAS